MRQVGPLSVAVLGLLNERPMHPYEVAFLMRQRHLDAHIKLNFGSLYHTFEQLERQGLVSALETERDGRRPERTVYQLTEQGRDAFLERLRHMLLQPEPAYTTFEAGLAFVYHLPPEEAAGLLRDRAQALEQEYEVHQALLEHHLRPHGLSRLSLIELEMVQDVRLHQAAWCRRIAGEIGSGQLQWRRGFANEHEQPDSEEMAPR